MGFAGSAGAAFSGGYHLCDGPVRADPAAGDQCGNQRDGGFMRKIIAILLAFLLTGALLLFCMSFLGRQALMPAMNEQGTPASDELIREEQQLIRERVTYLAELHGFQAEPVIARIDEDTLRELNAQASLWLSSILQYGHTGEDIRWDTKELERTIAEHSTVSEPGDEEAAEAMAFTAAEAVKNSVIRTVLPLRQQIIQLGLLKAGERIDLPNLITFFLGVPWAALALSALLAGLIALAGSRTIRGSLRYIGGALGAAALVLIAAAILYLCANILPMIREASESLAFMYPGTVSRLAVPAGILTAAMIAGSIVCLAMSRERDRNA